MSLLLKSGDFQSLISLASSAAVNMLPSQIFFGGGDIHALRFLFGFSKLAVFWLLPPPLPGQAALISLAHHLLIGLSSLPTPTPHSVT